MQAIACTASSPMHATSHALLTHPYLTNTDTHPSTAADNQETNYLAAAQDQETERHTKQVSEVALSQPYQLGQALCHLLTNTVRAPGNQQPSTRLLTHLHLPHGRGRHAAPQLWCCGPGMRVWGGKGCVLSPPGHADTTRTPCRPTLAFRAHSTTMQWQELRCCSMCETGWNSTPTAHVALRGCSRSACGTCEGGVTTAGPTEEVGRYYRRRWRTLQFNHLARICHW
jgi:hypothetical protein